MELQLLGVYVMTHAIGFMGYPGAGKTTAADHLSDCYTAPWFAMGDIVRERAKDELGEDAHSDEIGEWVTEQFEKHGKDVVIEWAIEKVRGFNDDFVFIDGIRTTNDVNHFAEEFDQFTLVYIHVPFDERLRRLQDRGREGEAEFTEEDLEERDAREDDWGVGTLVSEEYYDVKIGEQGSEEAFKAELENEATKFL